MIVLHSGSLYLNTDEIDREETIKFRSTVESHNIQFIFSCVSALDLKRHIYHQW